MIFLAAISLLVTVLYGAVFFMPVVHKLGKKILEEGGASAPSMVQDPLLYIALPAILNLNSKAREIAHSSDTDCLISLSRIRGVIFVILLLISAILIGITLAAPVNG